MTKKKAVKMIEIKKMSLLTKITVLGISCRANVSSQNNGIRLYQENIAEEKKI
jgi:hypothetical protein